MNKNITEVIKNLPRMARELEEAIEKAYRDRMNPPMNAQVQKPISRLIDEPLKSSYEYYSLAMQILTHQMISDRFDDIERSIDNIVLSINEIEHKLPNH